MHRLASTLGHVELSSSDRGGRRSRVALPTLRCARASTSHTLAVSQLGVVGIVLCSDERVIPRISRSEQEDEECVDGVYRAIGLLRCGTSHGRHTSSPGSRVGFLTCSAGAALHLRANEQCLDDKTRNQQLAQVT